MFSRKVQGFYYFRFHTSFRKISQRKCCRIPNRNLFHLIKLYSILILLIFLKFPSFVKNLTKAISIFAVNPSVSPYLVLAFSAWASGKVAAELSRTFELCSRTFQNFRVVFVLLRIVLTSSATQYILQSSFTCLYCCKKKNCLTRKCRIFSKIIVHFRVKIDTFQHNTDEHYIAEALVRMPFGTAYQMFQIMTL